MTQFITIPSGVNVNYFQPHDYQFRKWDIKDITREIESNCMVSRKYRLMTYKEGFLCPNYMLSILNAYKNIDEVEVKNGKTVPFGIYERINGRINWDNNLITNRGFTETLDMLLLELRQGGSFTLHLLSCRTSPWNIPNEFYTDYY